LQAFVTDNNYYPLFINPEYPKYPENLKFWMAALQNTEFPVPGNSTNHIPLSKLIGEGVWKCPAANRPSGLPPHRGYTSYGYNGFGMSARADTNSLGIGGHQLFNSSVFPAPPVIGSEVAVPSKIMAIADGFVGENDAIQDGAWLFWRTQSAEANSASTARAFSRHQGQANVVFCDGHLESPTLQFLFEDTSDEALSRWNRDHLPHRERL
jgi:prepilin-type processing-associated H-X9-DG protein